MTIYLIGLVVCLMFAIVLPYVREDVYDVLYKNKKGENTDVEEFNAMIGLCILWPLVFGILGVLLGLVIAVLLIGLVFSIIFWILNAIKISFLLNLMKKHHKIED